MDKDMKRLMRFGQRFGHTMDWMHNGSDAVESLGSLEGLDLIERNEAGDRWRLTDEGLVIKGQYDE